MFKYRGDLEDHNGKVHDVPNVNLTPIHEYPWHTLCAAWIKDIDNYVTFDPFNRVLNFRDTWTIVIVPQHILDMDEPPRTVAEWQQMVDDGTVEVIR